MYSVRSLVWNEVTNAEQRRSKIIGEDHFCDPYSYCTVLLLRLMYMVKAKKNLSLAESGSIVGYTLAKMVLLSMLM